jgi:hypothetical protein
VKDRDEWRNLRESSLSSHLNKKYDKEPKFVYDDLDEIIDSIDWSYRNSSPNKIVKMLRHYFSDMNQVFINLDSVLDHGTIACIVGNSSYGIVPIATDLFLGRQLRDLGYDVEIKVARKLETRVMQRVAAMHNNKYLRESIVIARKS